MLSTYSKVSFRKFCIDYNVYTIPYIYTSCSPLLAFETRSRHSSWEIRTRADWITMPFAGLQHYVKALLACLASLRSKYRHGTAKQSKSSEVTLALLYTSFQRKKKSHQLSRFHQNAVHFTNSKIKLLAWFAISICSLHWQLLAWRCHNWRWIFKIPPRPRFHLLGLGHALGKTFNAARWLWNCDSPHLPTHHP